MSQRPSPWKEDAISYQLYHIPMIYRLYHIAYHAISYQQPLSAVTLPDPVDFCLEVPTVARTPMEVCAKLVNALK